MQPNGHTSRKTASVDNLCFIGFDAEWKRVACGNQVISYQFACAYRGRRWKGIFYVDNGKRLKLKQLIGHILMAGKKAGVFAHYPRQVYLGSHFTLAEMSVLDDFDVMKKQFDGVRRSFVTAQKPLTIGFRDNNHNTRDVDVILRDTMHLTAQGSSLADLGEIHGIPKVTLPEGMIGKMDELLQTNPKLYEEYALTDACIALAHLLKMAELSEELTGILEVPITLGSLSVKFCRHQWKHEGLDENKILGNEIVFENRFDALSGKLRKVRERVALASRFNHLNLVTETFRGARNESFYFGPSDPGCYVDVDLAGAYPTALSLIGMPAWDQTKVTTDLDDYLPGVLGFAHVEFRFPESVRFPNLPIVSDGNLVFVSNGTAYATASEIWVARQLGAELKILHGVVTPMNLAIRPFRNVVKEATERRIKARAEGNQITEKLYKELINSLYGKTAQGTLHHRVFDTRAGSTKPIPESPLTNVAIASFVTGFIRALLSEILNRLPTEAAVISATTDGFLTDSDEVGLNLAVVGRLSNMFSEARRDLTGKHEVLAVKHRAQQVISTRTRGQFTLQREGDDEVILAKAGVKTPRGLTKVEQNEVMVESFLQRTPQSKYRFSNLTTLRDIYEKNGDLISENFERRLNLDYDFKRRPINGRMVEVRGGLHLAFDTVPWDSISDFEEVRRAWKVFREERCLMTVTDLTDFLDYYNGAHLKSNGLHRSKKGPVEVAKRQVLRAFTRGLWGLNNQRVTARQLATFLTSGGYATTLSDVKNASRRKSASVESIITETEEITKLIDYVKTLFPGFRTEKMLVPDTPAAETPQNWKAA